MDDFEKDWLDIKGDPAGRVYVGTRDSIGVCTVVIEENGRQRPLPVCLGTRCHSPDGFEWGYTGSGPAQLALAILVDAIGERKAVDLYQMFKVGVVAKFPEKGWRLTRSQIDEALEGFI